MNTFLLDSKHLHKGLSAGTRSVQMTTLLHFISPSGGRQKDRGTISKIETLGDSTWTDCLSKSDAALKKYTKFCGTLFILTNISWVRHCAKGCWRQKKKTTKTPLYPDHAACSLLFIFSAWSHLGWVGSSWEYFVQSVLAACMRCMTCTIFLMMMLIGVEYNLFLILKNYTCVRMPESPKA